MEIQPKDFLPAQLANSQFAQKLFEIPMIKAAVGTAGDAYAKVKDSNALVGRSIELAINISNAVVTKLSPIAEKGINAAAPITTKVDEFAAKGLDTLVARVPVINEKPDEIVKSINGYIVLVVSNLKRIFHL